MNSSRTDLSESVSGTPSTKATTVEVESIFERRVFVKKIENFLRMSVLFEFDDDADVFGRFIAKLFYAFEFFLAHEVGNAS